MGDYISLPPAPRGRYYRAKRADNMEWIYGFYTRLPNEQSYGTFGYNSGDMCWNDSKEYIIMENIHRHLDPFGNSLGDIAEYEYCQVLPNTVSQFTGLNDVHVEGDERRCLKTPVFEGDIFVFENYFGVGYDIYGVVFYDKLRAMYLIKPDFEEGVYPEGALKGKFFPLYRCCECTYSAHKVGNVWDNPELLKRGLKYDNQ